MVDKNFDHEWEKDREHYIPEVPGFLPMTEEEKEKVGIARKNNIQAQEMAERLGLLPKYTPILLQEWRSLYSAKDYAELRFRVDVMKFRRGGGYPPDWWESTQGLYQYLEEKWKE